MSTKSTHPILTDAVIAAMVRISFLDDAVDVLQEHLGPYYTDKLDGPAYDALSERWDDAEVNERRKIVLVIAGL